MNYYDARQRGSDKRWDYTCMNDNYIWPIGYCAGLHPFSEKWIRTMWGNLPEEVIQQEILKHKQKYDDDVAKYGHLYHQDGHASKEEAYECYRNYVLTHNLQIHKKPLNDDERHKHRKCGSSHDPDKQLHDCKEWTQNLVEVDHWWLIHLCDEHCNLETIRKLYPSVGSSISSY